jgi:NTP pyrophosphatase (non-canonical NTP hydrolase)
MDDEATVSEMMETVRNFCQTRDWDQFFTPKNNAIALVTEASELLEQFRFKGEEECREYLASAEGREAAGEELADILLFLLRFADLNGFDLSSELERKMAENEMKYPVAGSRGSNRRVR